MSQKSSSELNGWGFCGVGVREGTDILQSAPTEHTLVTNAMWKRMSFGDRGLKLGSFSDMKEKKFLYW